VPVTAGAASTLPESAILSSSGKKVNAMADNLTGISFMIVSSFDSLLLKRAAMIMQA
jgi:hypothetical protein